MCYECVDFSTIYREWMESGGLQKWRYDRRCGSSFPLPDGSSAECDPTGHSPCCNHVLGKCGNTAEYCSCYNCKDFKFTKEWIESGGKIRWRYDGRCGRYFRLPDHAPAQCDPDGANPCCNSAGGNLKFQNSLAQILFSISTNGYSQERANLNRVL